MAVLGRGDWNVGLSVIVHQVSAPPDAKLSSDANPMPSASKLHVQPTYLLSDLSSTKEIPTVFRAVATLQNRDRTSHLPEHLRGVGGTLLQMRQCWNVSLRQE